MESRARRQSKVMVQGKYLHYDINNWVLGIKIKVANRQREDLSRKE